MKRNSAQCPQMKSVLFFFQIMQFFSEKVVRVVVCFFISKVIWRFFLLLTVLLNISKVLHQSIFHLGSSFVTSQNLYDKNLNQNTKSGYNRHFQITIWKFGYIWKLYCLLCLLPNVLLPKFLYSLFGSMGHIFILYRWWLGIENLRLRS